MIRCTFDGQEPAFDGDPFVGLPPLLVVRSRQSRDKCSAGALQTRVDSGRTVDPKRPRRYVPARPSDEVQTPFAGQELNIAQHARRQAARKAAPVPRFFC